MAKRKKASKVQKRAENFILDVHDQARPCLIVRQQITSERGRFGDSLGNDVGQ
jgi:hypothetical protein